MKQDYTDQHIEAIRQRAERLVETAEHLGLIITIARRPMAPLAMGNHVAAVDVYPARHAAPAPPAAPEGERGGGEGSGCGGSEGCGAKDKQSDNAACGGGQQFDDGRAAADQGMPSWFAALYCRTCGGFIGACSLASCQAEYAARCEASARERQQPADDGQTDSEGGTTDAWLVRAARDAGFIPHQPV
jgi:hypothetical protein